MARLKGFHIRATYRMAKKNKPKRGLNWEWIYPRSEDVLKECGMKTMEEYILIRRQTIAASERQILHLAKLIVLQ